MVSGINASISSLLAAGYSQLGQAASVQQLRADEIANKARLQAEEAQKAQETVLPISRDGRSPYQGAFIGLEQRQQSLKDLLKPKADVLPSDEVALFGISLETEAPIPTAQTVFEQASDGVFYVVNDTSSARNAQAETASQRTKATRQQQVADLYLRNFNVQFEAAPAYSFAA